MDDNDEHDDDGGTPTVVCPVCGTTALLGEAGCPHWFASEGSDGSVFGSVSTGSVRRLSSRLCDLSEDTTRQLAATAPAEVARVLLAAIDEDGEWWRAEPGVQQSEEVEIDEASGTWGYWDWFHANPLFEAEAEAVATRVNAWLDDAIGVPES